MDPDWDTGHGRDLPGPAHGGSADEHPGAARAHAAAAGFSWIATGALSVTLSFWPAGSTIWSPLVATATPVPRTAPTAAPFTMLFFPPRIPPRIPPATAPPPISLALSFASPLPLRRNGSHEIA